MIFEKEQLFLKLCLLYLCIVLLFTVTTTALNTTIEKTLNAPGDNPIGLAWDGQYLWNTDINSDMIYKINPTNGNVIHSFESPVASIQGITYDGNNLWITEDWIFGEQEKIFKISTTNGQIISSFESPGTYPIGLAWDGQYLWNTDQDSKKIYQIDPSDGNIIKSFPSPGNSPTGIEWDGNFLWVVDRGSSSHDPIYKLNPFTGDIIEFFYSPGEFPNGLAWDGEYLWNVDDGGTSEKIYKIDVCRYSINYNVDPITSDNLIQLSPNQSTYHIGTNISITAIPSQDYRFDYWTGDLTGDNPKKNIVINSNLEFTAHFKRQVSLTTITEPVEAGKINLNPSGNIYDEGTEVVITAVSFPYYRFDYWTGNISGSDQTQTINMNSDKTIKAHFLKQYGLNIIIDPSNGGSISTNPSGNFFDSGTEVTATAKPNSDYRFSYWQFSHNNATYTTLSKGFFMSSNITLTAHFTKQVHLDVNCEPSFGGTIETTPDYNIYDQGTEITIKAIPATDFDFKKWSGDITSNKSTITITLNSDMKITAEFYDLNKEEALQKINQAIEFVNPENSYAMRLLDQAQENFNNNFYNDAEQLATNAIITQQQADDALNIITKAEEDINTSILIVVNLLNESQSKYENGSFIEAKTLAYEVIRVQEYAVLTYSILKNTTSVVDENLFTVKQLLNSAEYAFDNGSYEETIRLTQEAILVQNQADNTLKVLQDAQENLFLISTVGNTVFNADETLQEAYTEYLNENFLKSLELAEVAKMQNLYYPLALVILLASITIIVLYLFIKKSVVISKRNRKQYEHMKKEIMDEIKKVIK